jgi:lysine 2,3-aminomutase
MAGINDDVGTLTQLFHGLLRFRVRPYYLFQCDPVLGTAHFKVPVERAFEIMRGLRGHTTGYAVPTLAIDAPGGGGKIALLPESIVGRQNDGVLLRNFEGNVYHYPDPGGAAATNGR